MSDDPAAPARGILIALAVSLLFWGPLIWWVAVR